MLFVNVCTRLFDTRNLTRLGNLKLMTRLKFPKSIRHSMLDSQLYVSFLINSILLYWSSSRVRFWNCLKNSLFTCFEMQFYPHVQSCYRKVLSLTNRSRQSLSWVKCGGVRKKIADEKLSRSSDRPETCFFWKPIPKLVNCKFSEFLDTPSLKSRG